MYHTVEIHTDVVTKPYGQRHKVTSQVHSDQCSHSQKPHNPGLQFTWSILLKSPRMVPQGQHHTVISQVHNDQFSHSQKPLDPGLQSTCTTLLESTRMLSQCHKASVTRSYHKSIMTSFHIHKNHTIQVFSSHGPYFVKSTLTLSQGYTAVAKRAHHEITN